MARLCTHTHTHGGGVEEEGNLTKAAPTCARFLVCAHSHTPNTHTHGHSACMLSLSLYARVT